MADLTPMEQAAEAAAKEYLSISLTARCADSLDFHAVRVWQLKAALCAAYLAGQKSVSARPMKTAIGLVNK